MFLFFLVSDAKLNIKIRTPMSEKSPVIVYFSYYSIKDHKTIPLEYCFIN